MTPLSWQIGSLLPWLDLAGIALFAATGALAAAAKRQTLVTATFFALVTGVGGGTIRDILLNRVPGVLQSDVYAAAAIAGGLVVVIGLNTRLPRWVTMTAGAAVCFSLRMVAVWQHWNLPRVMAH